MVYVVYNVCNMIGQQPLETVVTWNPQPGALGQDLQVPQELHIIMSCVEMDAIKEPKQQCIITLSNCTYI